MSTSICWNLRLRFPLYPCLEVFVGRVPVVAFVRDTNGIVWRERATRKQERKDDFKFSAKITMRNEAHCAHMDVSWNTQDISTAPNLISTRLKSFVLNMRSDIKTGPIMMKSDADLPYINQVLIAHRARDIAYRMGPARKVQVVVPSSPTPRPQSACIRTLRSTRPRSNVSSNLRAAYGCVESLLCERRSEAEETGRIGNYTSSRVEHGEEWYPQSQVRASHDEDGLKDSSLCAAKLHQSYSEDTTHKAFRVADYEDSDDEDSLCEDDDIRALDLEANNRPFNCNKKLEIPQEHQLTTMQLRIVENVLRETAQQALKARRNDKTGARILSKEAPEGWDRLLEIILELLVLGQSMIDAGAFQREEGLDIQMMARKKFHVVVRKATRPFRPSGISVVKADLYRCLEIFRQERLRLLQENPGMSMVEILEKTLDLRPRQP